MHLGWWQERWRCGGRSTWWTSPWRSAQDTGNSIFKYNKIAFRLSANYEPTAHTAGVQFSFCEMKWPLVLLLILDRIVFNTGKLFSFFRAHKPENNCTACQWNSLWHIEVWKFRFWVGEIISHNWGRLSCNCSNNIYWLSAFKGFYSCNTETRPGVINLKSGVKVCACQICSFKEESTLFNYENLTNRFYIIFYSLYII